ncbi:cyclic nucleotide-binding domain-containing protein, partial [Thioclava sp. BHET1]
LVVVLAALAARAVILFGLLPGLALVRLSPVVQRPYLVAILWGGLRGAVTLALALAVTENGLVPPETRRLVGILATGFTLFTLVVQGSSLRWVISRLGLDRLSPLDTALSNQVIAVALQSVREQVSETMSNYDLSHDLLRSEAKAFGQRLEEAVKTAERSEEILDRDRVTLGVIALAGAERDMILARFRERAFPTRIADRILSNADQINEQTRQHGRLGYLRAGRAATAYDRTFRIAIWLETRLRISRPLARFTADRFELLLVQKLVLRDLDQFIDNRIRRIHGRRVADLLQELLERRQEFVEKALDGLRLQYPGYAEELERRFIRGSAMRFEQREYDQLRNEGLIGAELHTDLTQRLQKLRARRGGRPKLDIKLRKIEILREVPLFADLDPRSLRRLARAFVTRYAAAGEVILHRDHPPDTVYFIASGAVELKMASQTWRLGRGDLFGQLAILTRTARRSEVQAIAPSTLLALDERRFLRLLERSPALQEAVQKSADQRGVALETARRPARSSRQGLRG